MRIKVVLTNTALLGAALYGLERLNRDRGIVADEVTEGHGVA
jgi:hypothetical protein